ncbi:MAG: hypothetical protein GX488_10385, partial [Clostridiales bacterium]|nr:hypothetical protein [Clostridiales bacterium]
MKGQKMVKIFSVLMILCCLFAVCEGALSMLKLNDEKKICDSEIKDREMQIVQLENGIASLEKGKAGYESNLSALRKGKAAYETNKNAYEIGKAALDQRAAELAAAKEAGTIDEASAAATAAQLETLFAELQKNKANLEEYEKIKAEAEEYEEGKAQVDALITK